MLTRQNSTDWIQLLREWPPGYGGVERVAHELATSWQAMGRGVECLSLQSPPAWVASNHMPVTYTRRHLPCLKLGRFLIPLPSRRLLRLLLSRTPLVVHLPCPSLLLLSGVAQLLSPGRRFLLLWHAFLEPAPGPLGWLVGMYQWLALRWAALGPSLVLTTSPSLATALVGSGVPRQRIRILPCCLSEEAESGAEVIWRRRQRRSVRGCEDSFRLIYIGRLSSYKRVDWLIMAFPTSCATELHIVGDGPERAGLERLASDLGQAHTITFHGLTSEPDKQALLEGSDLLVLPSSSCHEAFGIVQLEAMACGVPALGFDLPRSGMAWVAGLEQALSNTEWRAPRCSAGLSDAIRQLVERPKLLQQASWAARMRYERIFARRHWERRLRDCMP